MDLVVPTLKSAGASSRADVPSSRISPPPPEMTQFPSSLPTADRERAATRSGGGIQRHGSRCGLRPACPKSGGNSPVAVTAASYDPCSVQQARPERGGRSPGRHASRPRSGPPVFRGVAGGSYAGVGQEGDVDAVSATGSAPCRRPDPAPFISVQAGKRRTETPPGLTLSNKANLGVTWCSPCRFCPPRRQHKRAREKRFSLESAVQPQRTQRTQRRANAWEDRCPHLSDADPFFRKLLALRFLRSLWLSTAA